MITFEDFLKNKEVIIGSSKYKHYEYDDPNNLFKAILCYDYIYGWGVKIEFKENPDVGIFFEDGSDNALSVIDSLNTCMPFYNKIKNEEGDPVGFELKDFSKTIEGHYEYEDPNKIYRININSNGIDYCELSAFFGIETAKSVNVFFEQDTIEHTLASFNQCLVTILDMYNAIKDLKVGDEND